MRDRGYLCVRGNHEQMMIDAVLHYSPGGSEPMDWLESGGIPTVANYGMTPMEFLHRCNEERLPLDMIKDARWMDALPHYLEFPDLMDDLGRHLVVSHSGILPFWEIRDTPQGQEKVLWGRSQAFNHVPHLNSFYNVFGHTAKAEIRILDNVACIDTAAAWAVGWLTALHWPSRDLYISRDD